MSRGAGQSRDGSHAALVVVSAGEATRRRCRNDLWDQAGSEAATASEAASVVVLLVASEVALEAEREVIAVSEAAATLAAAVAASVEEASEVAVAEAATVTLVVVVAAALATASAAVVAALAKEARTDTLHQTLPTDPAADSADLAAAVRGGSSLARAVGMAGVTVVVAHMMTGPEATVATVAAEIVAETVAEIGEATATLARAVATWSLSVRAGTTVVPPAAETTTDLETTTHGSAATKAAATKIPGSCDATNKTFLKMSCGLVSQSVSHFRLDQSPFATKGKAPKVC